jgi:Ca-activated chloride channel family protein
MTGQAVVAALAMAVAVTSYLPAAQRFSSNTLGVRVDVLVTENGRPLGGLTARDFVLRDNGIVQRVSVIDSTDVPVNAVLALDTSASIVGRRRSDLIAAGEALIDGLKPIDRVGLTTFSHAVTPTASLTSDFSSTRAALRAIDPRGLTSVMDGVYTALTATIDQPGRFLLVVCTDGADTTSWLQPAEVLDASKRANAVIYAVTATDGSRSSALKALVEGTGGQVMPVKSSSDLRPAFERILTEFRSRYVLTYSPEGVAPGGFHRLEVAVPRRHAVVKARSGYVGVGVPKRP